MSNQFCTMSNESIQSHIERAERQIKTIVEVKFNQFPTGETGITETLDCLKELVTIYKSELFRRDLEMVRTRRRECVANV